MARAYALAQLHRTHPNPRVGCVVVAAGGEVLATGSHSGPGEPHAELVALDQVTSARGSTVYVSLEPCVHHGRTPPCVDRLIAEGVASVVVGVLDPDQRVDGRGVEALRAAGIAVNVLDDPLARAVDPGYFHHRETGMPLVRLKWAMTIDGNVAASDGTSRWITSEDAREDVHIMRSEVDAVVVGAGTLRSDDPRLDARLGGPDTHQPRPVVVAGNGDLPENAAIWARDPIVVTTRDRPTRSGELVQVGGIDGLPDPVEVCLKLADLGLLDVLVEGGPKLASAWWKSGVVDTGVVYIGPLLGGGAGLPPMSGPFATIEDSDSIVIETVEKLQSDVRITFKKKG